MPETKMYKASFPTPFQHLRTQRKGSSSGDHVDKEYGDLPISFSSVSQKEEIEYILKKERDEKFTQGDTKEVTGLPSYFSNSGFSFFHPEDREDMQFSTAALSNVLSSFGNKVQVLFDRTAVFNRPVDTTADEKRSHKDQYIKEEFEFIETKAEEENSDVEEPPASIVSSPALRPTKCKENNIFRLRQEPFSFQRRCYPNEKRYLMPNPLSIVPSIDTQDQIVEGNTEVELVDENYKLVDSSEGTLENILGGLSSKFNALELSTSFTLKLTTTSVEDIKYRLKFTVVYLTTAKEAFKEIIYSAPFQIISNKKLQKIIEAPYPKDILPKKVPTTSDSEIWIKGSKLNVEGLEVRIDNRPAPIKLQAANLLVVSVPARTDMTEDKIVDVVITYPKSTKPSESRKLFLLYECKGNATPEKVNVKEESPQT